ncbi:COMM domain-containing protein 10 isoform X6 [Dasypus novemcinctus]|uniref:COMM domain-containing protein 10 isoform X6 n=1 Tax=Dasypus novemcinctus TaxID=9361 RepID=UPI0039C99E7E
MAAAAPLILRESPSMKKAVLLINAIDIGRFPRLLTRILQKLHLKAVYHNVKPAALQQQLENIHLRQDKAEAFVNAWSTMGQETVEKFRQRILAPHKLETVGWQLNLHMAHSAQANLKSPQAVLQLEVSNEDSKSLEKVLMEFSHKELFEFYNKLETIQAQLDSLT